MQQVAHVMIQETGYHDRKYGRFINLVQNQLNMDRLTFMFLMRFIKLIYYIFHMIDSDALTVVDVASRYKEAVPLSTKSSSEVAAAFKKYI